MISSYVCLKRRETESDQRRNLQRETSCPGTWKARCCHTSAFVSEPRDCNNKKLRMHCQRLSSPASPTTFSFPSSTKSTFSTEFPMTYFSNWYSSFNCLLLAFEVHVLLGATKKYWIQKIKLLLRAKVAEMQAEYFPPREEVILENETPTDMYILVSGSVVSTSYTPG